MTVRTLFFSICALSIAAAALAQTPPAPQTLPTPQTAPAPQTTPPAPRREGQAVNIKFDVTITDQHGGGAGALKKTVSVVAADSFTGRIRTAAMYTGGGLADVPLNVDVEPQLIADGKIRARIDLWYDLPIASTGQETPGIGYLRKTSIRENLSLVLENGKPLVAAQSADPVGDRQVIIEVKATVLR